MIQQLKNKLWLYRVNKDISILGKDVQDKIHRLVDWVSVKNSATKKKLKTERNLIASILKQVRTLHPYKVIGETEVEKLYKEYFTLDNHIPNFKSVKVGQYLKRFRNYYPAKGERYCQYHENYSSGKLEVFKVEELTKYGSFRLSDATDSYWEDSLSDYDITAFLFATKQEIQQFKSRKKEYKEMQKLIDRKQKELEKLKSKQRKI